jgi:hypothetical protein
MLVLITFFHPTILSTYTFRMPRQVPRLRISHNTLHLDNTRLSSPSNLVCMSSPIAYAPAPINSAMSSGYLQKSLQERPALSPYGVQRPFLSIVPVNDDAKTPSEDLVRLPSAIPPNNQILIVWMSLVSRSTSEAGEADAKASEEQSPKEFLGRKGNRNNHNL